MTKSLNDALVEWHSVAEGALRTEVEVVVWNAVLDVAERRAKWLVRNSRLQHAYEDDVAAEAAEKFMSNLPDRDPSRNPEALLKTMIDQTAYEYRNRRMKEPGQSVGRWVDEKGRSFLETIAASPDIHWDDETFRRRKRFLEIAVENLKAENPLNGRLAEIIFLEESGNRAYIDIARTDLLVQEALEKEREEVVGAVGVDKSAPGNNALSTRISRVKRKVVEDVEQQAVEREAMVADTWDVKEQRAHLAVAHEIRELVGDLYNTGFIGGKDNSRGRSSASTPRDNGSAA